MVYFDCHASMKTNSIYILIIQISKPKTTTKTTEGDSRCVALSMHTAPPIDGIGVDKKMPP